ncbi:hypothetical protein LCGC14_2921550, partial [marine sediment metagenome]
MENKPVLQLKRELRVETFRQSSFDTAHQMFKDDEGKPMELTDNQCDIFTIIYHKLFNRNHIKTFTRFGKSLTVGLAVLARISTYPEKWCIASGNKEQAGIIMSYIIQHIFDNEYTMKKFVPDKGDTMEAIRRYKNKNRLNFLLTNGLLGEVFITNAKGAMGFGAPNVVLDEAALISDDEEALVFRMLGDQLDNFYFKIGNPWESGHFRETDEDPNYFNMTVNWKEGIREERITMEQVQEAKRRPFFDVMYECKFPPRDAMDDKAWIPLLTRDDIDRALIDEITGFGLNKLGVDVAGEGRNFSVIIQRFTNFARLLYKKNEPDTMAVGEVLINAKHK